jgi:hypothetical protein
VIPSAFNIERTSTSQRRRRASTRGVLQFTRRSRFGCLVICAICFATRNALAIETLDGADLKQQLASRVDITWSGRELRDALATFSNEYHVATYLDRRVDPSRNVDLAVQDASLAAVLQRIADEHDLGLAWLGPVAYFGPRHTADRLRTLAFLHGEEIRALPPARRQALLRAEPLSWDELATPREVIKHLADQRGLSVVNLDQVPHDLWLAGQLPPLPMHDQLSLLCAGFEFTFQIDSTGEKVLLGGMPSTPAILRYYPAGSQTADRLIAAWTGVAPGAMYKAVGDRIAVKGRLEDHERIEAHRRGEQVASTDQPPSKRPAPPGAKKVYSLKNTRARVNQILAAIAPKEGLEIRPDKAAIAAAGIDMEQIVTLNVEDVTIDELIAAVLKQAGLQHRREGNVIHVFPAPRQ